MADINVATDVALCRGCGQASPFSAIAGVGTAIQADLDHPPKHIRVEDDGWGGTVITYRRWSPVLFFLIPFTCLWGGISVGAIYILPLLRGTGIDPGQALFGLPFLGGTLVLLAVIAFLLFGRWEIRLRDREGSAFVGLGSIGWRRAFALDRGTTVAFAQCGASVNHQPVPCIQVTTAGTSVNFGAFIHADSKHHIAARIRQHALALAR